MSFDLSPELIERVLGIPEGHQIVGAFWNFETSTIRLFVEGPDLPEVDEGVPLRTVKPVIRDGEFDWNLDA